MKKYNVIINVFKEEQAFKLMKDKGNILSVAGGYPVCPFFVTWEGKEETLPELEKLAEVHLQQ